MVPVSRVGPQAMCVVGPVPIGAEMCILYLRHRVLAGGGVDTGALAAAHPVVAVAHL
jgi:hypothetical protein